MSKKIVNYILFSVVISIITTVGSYTCKGGGSDTQMVIVQHPDGCFLLSPKPFAAGISAGGDMVNVHTGPVKFEFDCDGSDITVTKTVDEGEMTVRVDPTVGSK